MNEENDRDDGVLSIGWHFPEDLLEAAWGIIANAGEGDWTKESQDWQEAARRWGDAYFESMTAPTKDTESMGGENDD